MMQKQQQAEQQLSLSSANLHLSMARNPSEIAEAQRLRYKVFVEEMGAHTYSLETATLNR